MSYRMLAEMDDGLGPFVAARGAVKVKLRSWTVLMIRVNSSRISDAAM